MPKSRFQKPVINEYFTSCTRKKGVFAREKGFSDRGSQPWQRHLLGGEPVLICPLPTNQFLVIKIVSTFNPLPPWDDPDSELRLLYFFRFPYLLTDGYPLEGPLFDRMTSTTCRKRHTNKSGGAKCRCAFSQASIHLIILLMIRQHTLGCLKSPLTISVSRTRNPLPPFVWTVTTVISKPWGVLKED